MSSPQLRLNCLKTMTIKSSVRPLHMEQGARVCLNRTNNAGLSFSGPTGAPRRMYCCMQLIWNEKLKTGVAELDNDHRLLIALVNDLQSAGNALALTGTLNKQPIADLLQRLHNHSAAHHEREELLLFQCGHPCLERRLRRGPQRG